MIRSVFLSLALAIGVVVSAQQPAQGPFRYERSVAGSGAQAQRLPVFVT